MSHNTSRRRALRTMVALPAALAIGTVHAQSAALQAPIATASPLVALDIAVAAPGYNGPATILIFDPRKRLVGSFDGQITNGSGSIRVTPRGALGPHWAALFASGQQVAINPVLYTLDAQTTVLAGEPRFDQFVPNARTLMAGGVLEYQQKPGVRARGYRSSDSALIWLRDHVYAARAARYIDADLRITLDLFRDAQLADGSLPDVVVRPLVAPQAFRTPVEADVEFVYVQGVFEVWQASADDTWARGHLGTMRRAISYTLQNPLRWDKNRGLVRRPYTIDMWDFEYGPTTTDPNSGKPAPRHWLDERTIWGTFHGDNTGTAQALRMLAQLEDRIGDAALGKVWRDVADGIIRNLTALAWNGSFYRHHVPERPFDTPGIDESRQLSLSNAYALNRGILTDAQGQALVDEYISRSKTTRAFAEWYSINPPFPAGSYGLGGRTGEKPGEYVNGGIMPLVGGELARGAFRYGNESYGFAILDYYWQRMLSRGRSFLWYGPDGAEGVGSDDTTQYDAWGCGAMLDAMIEGAVGVADRGAAMRDVVLSPRWAATSPRGVYAVVRYPASDGYVAYTYNRAATSIDVQISSSADRIRLRVLLPPAARDVTTVTRNGGAVPYTIETIRFSRYVVLDIADVVAQVQVSWRG